MGKESKIEKLAKIEKEKTEHDLALEKERLKKETLEKEIKEENLNLPERVEYFGQLIFSFETGESNDFLRTLAQFKKLNKELKITAVSPLLSFWSAGERARVNGYCVNCEREEEKEEEIKKEDAEKK